MKSAVWTQADPLCRQLTPYTGSRLVGVEGTPLSVRGKTTADVSFGSERFQVPVIVVDQLSADVILGLDFLEDHRCTIDIASRVLLVGGSRLRLPLVTGDRSAPEDNLEPVTVSIVKTVQVPPMSEMEIRGEVKQLVSGTWVVERVPLKASVVVARAVVCPGSNHGVCMRVINPTPDMVTLYKGTKVAILEAVDDTTPVAAVRQGFTLGTTDEDLREIANQCHVSVSASEREQLFQLLVEYRDIFASSSSDLGRTSQVQHRINTGGHPPIRQPVRRVPAAHREQAREGIQDMLQKGIISPSSSPWASPLVLVRKKDGSMRYCVDYRQLNSVTRKDAYPIPRIDETLDTLAGSCIFTTLDLLSGYWQVEVQPEDREKTAVCTPDGLFEFNVMPFGLCNAPATFQRLMDCVLAGLHWQSCLVYLDDVIILGRSFSEHLHNLRDVFDRFREAGLKLKPSKCTFGQKEVAFLGHIVSDKGVATDPAKVAAITNWPTPRNRKEVQQFLGLGNYYRRFIKDFATIAKPLHRLTETGREFLWTESCEEAFRKLQGKLASTPILAFPDFAQTFVLDTDASNEGIGAVLSQVEDGKEIVIAYASRVLTKAERAYCITRRELLAVVTFIQHFRAYLLGRHFVIRTDHGSLTWLRSFRNPEGQLARWLEQLQEYDFDIVHRPGRKHLNADALSRIPCQQCGRESHAMDTEQPTTATAPVNMVGEADLISGLSRQEVREAQLSDPNIGDALRAKEETSDTPNRTLQGRSPTSKRLFQLWDQLRVKDGLLWRMYESVDGTTFTLQLVVPGKYRQQIVQELHSGALGGHLGADKTHAKLKERFYWPGYWTEVRLHCEACTSCATRKTPAPKRRAPLQPIQAGHPLEIVAMDLTGPFPESPEGNRYILVVGDYFTKWMEAYALPDQEATTVAQKLVDEFFCRFSVPEQLHSDQGKQLNPSSSPLFVSYCR